MRTNKQKTKKTGTKFSFFSLGQKSVSPPNRSLTSLIFRPLSALAAAAAAAAMAPAAVSTSASCCSSSGPPAGTGRECPESDLLLPLVTNQPCACRTAIPRGGPEACPIYKQTMNSALTFSVSIQWKKVSQNAPRKANRHNQDFIFSKAN